MMKILITGSTGFVGQHLVRSFQHDYILIGLDRSPNPFLPPEHRYSWNEMPEIPPTDVIIHLAGIAHDLEKKKSSHEYIEVNVGLTEIIFNYFLHSKATKFIFISSIHAVSEFSEQILHEEVEPQPTTSYGQSKRSAEKIIQMSPLPSEKKVYILRPAMIHGPGNKGNLNLLTKVIRWRIPWPLGRFRNQRSFLSVGNLVFIIRKLIENDIPSGVYHLADDETLSTNDLIMIMAEVSGRKPTIWNIPRGIIRFTAKMGDFLRIPLNTTRLSKLTGSYVVSNQKIKTALNVDHLPVPAREGMKLTLSSMLKQNDTNTFLNNFEITHGVYK